MMAPVMTVLVAMVLETTAPVATDLVTVLLATPVAVQAEALVMVPQAAVRVVEALATPVVVQAEALVMMLQAAVLVIVPQAVVRAVAGLVMVPQKAVQAVALHMSLLAEVRLEAGLEEIPLMPPIEVARPVVVLAAALMLPLTIAQPAEANPLYLGFLQ